MKNPVKFEDLAFILLFFFIAAAIVSYSNSQELSETENTYSDEETEGEVFSVFLSSDLQLMVGENCVPFDSFSAGSSIELSCSKDLVWNEIITAVERLYSNGCSVVLVLQ